MKSAPRSFRKADAFTVIELLVVMSIITVLAGLVLATSGYVQEKSKRSRAEAEIAALSAALESYKADMGVYPSDNSTDNLNPNSGAASDYRSASAFLYRQLAGDLDGDRVSEAKSYFDFKPAMLAPAAPATPISAILDPFGNSYGYSTMKASDPNAAGGFNPTFDLWSTAGLENGGNRAKWITNW